jgi:hypothetical protein
MAVEATEMDVSELRKRILRAIDDARRDASDRRTIVDEASKAYATFLEQIAVPLLKQSATVLNATGAPFVVHAPAGSARLASEHSPETFLEFELDATRPNPEVVGRVSLARGGRAGQIVAERPIVPDRPVGRLTEDDVSQFLVVEIPKLVVKP